MTAHPVGTVASLHRYPVKSMLGETCDTLALSAAGAEGDRAWAVLDTATGKVASAKRPHLWRGLLACAARTERGGVELRLPDGTTHPARDPALPGLLSALLGRPVRLADQPPAGAELDRAHPEAQLDAGLDADVASDILAMGAAAPPGTFMDYAPLHLVTSATLDGLADPGDPVETARYRPNIVIASPDGTPAFPENAWLDGTLSIGDTVRLRIVLQTPRCAIPALAHGTLPPRPGAVRAPAQRNRVDVPGFGLQPCAGVYAAVLQGGTVRTGDAVRFAPRFAAPAG